MPYFKVTHFFLFNRYSPVFLCLHIRSVTQQAASHKLLLYSHSGLMCRSAWVW